MWEILVPTVKPNTNGKEFFKTRYHKVWDTKVRQLTDGLTILNPVKGQWVSPDNTLFRERMIPVRIIASEEDISNIIQMTGDYYEQEAVLCYRISDLVVFTLFDRKNSS